MTQMDSDVPWFRELSAQDRSWVGLIVQSGVRGFVDWFGNDGGVPGTGGTALAASVFGSAPRALAGVISLQQTVDLVRLSIDVVERNLDDVLDADDTDDVHAALLRYAREVAFATAEVYARAAEVRGAWDARLEALVVDSVLRAEADGAVQSRASALGWSARRGVVTVVGGMPSARTAHDLFGEVRRRASDADLDALCAVQGHHLVVILGGVDDALRAGTQVADAFAAGPVVVGPWVEALPDAHLSAAAAMSGLRSVGGRPDAPRPVPADDLLPERVLLGDEQALTDLLDQVYRPLVEARGSLLDTVAAYLTGGASLERCARVLFVHPNTVRYRLRQVADLTGMTPTDPRDAFVLHVALVIGRQQASVVTPATSITATGPDSTPAASAAL